MIATLAALLQVDVLEVQYCELMKSLARASDFDSVRRAHDVFLSSLAQDCFLLHKVCFVRQRTIFEAFVPNLT